VRWGKVKLGDVCEICSGGTPRRSEPKYWKGNIPWVKISDMLQKRISTTEEKITVEGLRNSSAKLLPKGTILVSIFATIGRTAILEIEAATNQAIVGISPKIEDKFNLRFLEYCLQEKELKLRQLARGVAQSNINLSIIRELEIPLPPFEEQKRIAAILDAAEALRVKRRQALKELDIFLQATFLYMFGDPVTNPKGWEKVKFEALGKTRLGKMLDKKKKSGDHEFPYLANFNVQWGEIIFDDLRTMDFSKSEREEFKLEKGDLLICEGGEIGRTAIWKGKEKDIYFQKALHRVRLAQNVSTPEYVMFYMCFMARNGGFKDFSNSSTIAHLTGIKLKKMPVPLPPFSLQQQFAAIVESVERQKNIMKAHLAELDALFGCLQQRAFNGEL